MQRLRRLYNEDEGFTLIELLMVIIILAILATVVVFSVTGITSNGTAAACQTTVKTVDTAAESYFAQNATGATTLGALVSGGFLHSDSNFTTASGTSQVVANGSGKTVYTILFSPVGSATVAGGADTTVCPTH